MTDDLDPKTPAEIKSYMDEQFRKSSRLSARGKFLPDIDNDTLHMQVNFRVEVLHAALERALTRIEALEAKASAD